MNSLIQAGKKHFKGNKSKKIGVIDESLLNYIRPKLIILATLFVSFTAIAFETLYTYFETNIALNGLIVSLIIFACYMVIENNLALRKTAQFVGDMERVGQQDDVTEGDIARLKKMLLRKGRMLNTKNMHDVLDKMGTYHHPNFTDTDARLIKSKFGGRVAYSRKGVLFIAGMLVMLGLLGTFMGLLKTIDSVGLALNSMASLGQGGGELGLEEMSAFIGSLAGPLQGMGLAFSSSLFGLAGSLVINVFASVSADAQNDFIENLGRWMDDRILTPSKAMSGAASKGVQGADMNDLQTWLAGFIYLSNKTNKRLSKLSMLLYKAQENQVDVHETCKEIASHQKESNETLRDMLGEVVTMKEGAAYVKGAVDNVLEQTKVSQDMQAQTVKLLESDAVATQALTDKADEGNAMLGSLSEQANSGNVMLGDLVEKVAESTEVSKEYKEQFVEVMEDAVERQTGHMDKNAELLSTMLNDQLQTVNEGINRGVEGSEQSKDQLAASIADAVEKQSAHMERSSEMLVSTLSDMFEDMNDKVENNVLEFVQKKSELDDVRGDLEVIMSSQGDLQGDFESLIKEMHNHNEKMQSATVHIMPATNEGGTKPQKKRSIVQKIFSSGEE